MSDRLTDAELVARLQAKDKVGPGAAAKLFGVSSGTFRESIREAERRNLTPHTIVMDEKEKLKVRVRELEQALKAAKRDADSAEEIRARIYELAQRSPEPPEWTVRDMGPQGYRGIPCTMWSDWHRGEIVRPEEVNGLNEFNSEIHDERVKRLVDRTVDLAYNHMGRAKTKYPGIVIFGNGDWINGDIHEELQINSDRTTQQNINQLTDIGCAALETMAQKFGRVFFVGTVGNHGRGTLKPRMKGAVYTSHEWNIYTNMERHFRRSKYISFYIPSGPDAYVPIVGTRYLATHGDRLGVKGGDGIIGAIGPIMRGSIKVGSAESTVGRDVDCIVLGHWHQCLWLPRVIVNNALKGFDDFAQNALRAPYSRPSQNLWFTHPEHGITARWEVFLEGQKFARRIDPEPGVPDWVQDWQRRA